MTTIEANSAAPVRHDQPTGDAVRTRTSKARVGIVLVMLVAIVAAGLTRDWATRRRVAATVTPGTDAASTRSSLGSMNSFSLALLLGGLRGPLVMFLWSTSESQKADKNLEDFDTKVEWIRLLQPEFDTVHIFQIWNKAYNISVQMASLANKYTTILDALEYARNVKRARPDNINITVSMAQVYSDKLGSSNPEKTYYKARVRRESLPHLKRQRMTRDDPAWRPLELDQMLDEKGNILPELLRPTRVIDATRAASGSPSLFNDGSELQYLAPFQPFRYGLSPWVLGYNYYKQAQVLQRVSKQKHQQLSDLVVDSRPALTLKLWAEDEADRGRRLELAAYGVKVAADQMEQEKVAMEGATVTPPAGVTPDAAKAEEALDAYAVAARTAVDSVAQYEDHLRYYPNNQFTYESHIDGLVALRELALADGAFLRAVMNRPGDDRAALRATAAEHYQAASDANLRILLRYYIDDVTASRVYPAGTSRDRVKAIAAADLPTVYANARQAVMDQGGDPYAEDRAEYESYIARAQGRLASLRK